MKAQYVDNFCSNLFSNINVEVYIWSTQKRSERNPFCSSTIISNVSQYHEILLFKIIIYNLAIYGSTLILL